VVCHGREGELPFGGGARNIGNGEVESSSGFSKIWWGVLLH
jgi:hypothetical protein